MPDGGGGGGAAAPEPAVTVLVVTDGVRAAAHCRVGNRAW